MVNKIIVVIIDILFPKSHLQMFLRTCSHIKFESKLTPRLQTKEHMFYPFYYKDPFVRDCIFELKERNSLDVAGFFGQILSRWIIKKIHEIRECVENPLFYIVPVPQHISKTKEKGFCHTTTLANSICSILQVKYPRISVSVFPCVVKNKKTKRLHDTLGKQKRFNMIGQTMIAHITKQDAHRAYFFIIDDVYTTGATFKEVRRSLSDCAVLLEHMFFVSVAH